MTKVAFERRRWLIFMIVSALFFHITASTFTSLGVVFLYMFEDLKWSNTQAGLGFTLLAAMVGLSGTVPAWIIRRFGIKATFAIGGALMAFAFGLLATMSSVSEFLVAASILGVGYTLCATVPGVHVINNWFADKREFAIGTYMTIGGSGGVAGPLTVTIIEQYTDSWRVHWWAMAVSIIILAVIAVIYITKEPDQEIEVEEEAKKPRAERSDHIYVTKTDWAYRNALRVPQYYVIVAAMTMVLFCEVSMNSFEPIHLVALGFLPGTAASALSGHQLVNALSRGLGGIVGNRIDPKWLLASALVAEMIGMWALAIASNPVVVAIFAFGAGYGFGMCLFSTAILLVNYFGTTNNPAIFGTMHVFTSVAAAAPVMTGFVGDTVGSFAIVFQSFAVILIFVLIAVIMMQPPVQAASQETEIEPAE